MAIKIHQIGIPLTDCRIVAFERPFQDGEVWSRAFSRVARAVSREYADRRITALGRRNGGANAWLTQVAYDLLLPMLEDDQLDMLIAWTRLRGRYARNDVVESLTPFQVGLMALFADDPKVLSSQTRERLGKRLWYACRHYVPVEFVLGFLAQLDSRELDQRMANRSIEAGFEDWIAARKVEDEDGNLDRGSYPKAIDERVRLLQRESAGNHDDDLEEDEDEDELVDEYVDLDGTNDD